MVGKSLFAQTIEWRGGTWHLQYDPADEISVMPDLSNGTIKNISCSEVTIPGMPEGSHYYMVVVDIEIPAVMYGNEMRAAKQLTGFRIYNYRPADPTGIESLRLPEMVFYIREPVEVPVDGTAQAFLSKVLGHTLAEAEQKHAIDRSWSKDLLSSSNNQPVTNTAADTNKTEA